MLAALQFIVRNLLILSTIIGLVFMVVCTVFVIVCAIQGDIKMRKRMNRQMLIGM